MFEPNIYTHYVYSPYSMDTAKSKIDWHCFLNRPPLPEPSTASLDLLRKASILVTGAGGSIGSDLSLQLASLGPRRLVLIESSEQALFRLSAALEERGYSDLQLILGNVADEALLEETFHSHRPAFVFHAAAYKHVCLLENHPLAAVKNNSLATHSLATVATKYKSRIVLLSTDKAVDPTSILGASKRIAELIVIAAGGVVMRLVNVLGSRGSVTETLLQQINSSNPMVITDAGAERYFITSDEAVALLMATAVEADSGSLFVPALETSHSVVSLALFLASQAMPHHAVPLTFTQLRCGEKLKESLWSPRETPLESNIKGTIRISRDSHFAEDALTAERTILQLQSAAAERDLPEVLEAVARLVPSYTPSKTVQILAVKSAPGFQPA